MSGEGNDAIAYVWAGGGLAKEVLDIFFFLAERPVEC
jgi:hypothetical protein